MPEAAVTPESTATPSASTATSTTTPATTVADSSATTAAEKTYSFKEDRATWVDPNKHKMAERATERAVRESDQLRRDLDAATKRIQALAGVVPEDKDAAEMQKVMDALYAQAPHLRPESIAEAKEMAKRLQDAEREKWDGHRDQQFDKLSAKMAKAIGIDKLDAKTTSKLTTLFRNSYPDPEREPDAFGEWYRKYSRGDESLLDDFIDDFSNSFLKPAQRASLVRPKINVPSGGFSRPVVRTEERPKPGNLDAAMDRYVKILREGTA